MKEKLLLGMLLVGGELPAEMMKTWEYPEARKGEVVDDWHGVSVADPYRWLEDLEAEQTKAWVAAQNRLSDAYFDQAPGREWIEGRLKELWKYDKYSLPRKAGGRLFYSKKTGLQNQSILYWKEDTEGSEPRVLLDQNLLSEDGTVALSGWTVTKDGKWMAYGLSEGGSDWQEWRIREVETGRDLEEVIQWVKFSGASWVPDGSGFYYSRYEEPGEGEELEAVNVNQRVYFHRRGTPQAEDKLIYERPDEPKWGFGAFVTEDERFLCLSVWQGAGGKNGFFYRDLKTDREEFVEWNADFESRWNFLGNDGTVFYFETDQAAPNGRIVSCDVSGQEPPVLNEILSEGDHALDSVSLIGDRLIVSRMVDVLNEVTIYDLEGREERKVELPGVGSIWGFGGEREADEVFYYFSSYTVPGSVYRYDLEAGTSALFAKPETVFEAEKYETKQFFYPSKDGTLVPLFVTVAKDREGPVPLYLYGYGGFNVSLTPYYSTSIATWLDMGGAYVVANLRGGGEFGEAWHEAGMKDQKQNVFDDFQAAATFLVSEGWTTHEQLAIGGGSNGGLLVGACVNQRPGLYRAAVAQVGVYDMLRFPKFTIGWAWTDDYGDPKVKEEFESLYAYSPYHQAREQDYPALLLTTADHDDRVHPAHTFKYGAALQAVAQGPHPVLLRIETKAGHGAGKPTSKAIEEIADQWCFLAKELGMALPPNQ